LTALGSARLHLGQLDIAGQPLREGLRLARLTDMGQAQLVAGSQLAVWQASRGRLCSAAHTARETLALAERLGLTRLADLGWARIGLAEVHYQRDHLDDAVRLVEESLDHAYGDPAMLVAGMLVQARVRFAMGHVAEAYESLLTARHEAACATIPGSLRRALSLCESELRLAGGDLGAARRWLGSWSTEEPFPDWVATVEAGLLLAEGKAAAAAAAVAASLAGSDVHSSLTWRVQAALVTALAGRALGDRTRMVHGLDLALEAAEEEGFRRLFRAGGHALRELITAVGPGLSVYRGVIADLAEAPDPSQPPTANNSAGALYARVPRTGPLTEPLTERELTVLRYLQGTLSNVEIASMLYVSVNTVKTHVKNIYRKLDAGQRREAVRRARDLRLL
jgi:LuxR family maltose regulon positive regulatory protein